MRILLAVDGSKYSDLAARFLACLHLSADDEITVLHVMFWYPLYYEREYYYETLKEIKQEIAPKILDAALDINHYKLSVRQSSAINHAGVAEFLIARNFLDEFRLEILDSAEPLPCFQVWLHRRIRRILSQQIPHFRGRVHFCAEFG